MRKKIYSKYLSNNSKIKFKQLLKAARDDAHKRLEKLKILYAEAKLPIKQSFAPEVWNVFGVPDKR